MKKLLFIVDEDEQSLMKTGKELEDEFEVVMIKRRSTLLAVLGYPEGETSSSSQHGKAAAAPVEGRYPEGETSSSSQHGKASAAPVEQKMTGQQLDSLKIQGETSSSSPHGKAPVEQKMTQQLDSRWTYLKLQRGKGKSGLPPKKDFSIGCDVCNEMAGRDGTHKCEWAQPTKSSPKRKYSDDDVEPSPEEESKSLENKKNIEYLCNRCKIVLNSVFLLGKHRKNHMKNGECPDCDHVANDFGSPSGFSGHIGSHDKKKLAEKKIAFASKYDKLKADHESVLKEKEDVVFDHAKCIKIIKGLMKSIADHKTLLMQNAFNWTGEILILTNSRMQDLTTFLRKLQQLSSEVYLLIDEGDDLVDRYRSDGAKIVSKTEDMKKYA